MRKNLKMKLPRKVREHYIQGHAKRLEAKKIHKKQEKAGTNSNAWADRIRKIHEGGVSLKAEEFVKHLPKRNPGRAFCKKCLNERATRNLCVALFEEKSIGCSKMEQSTSRTKRKVYENLCSSRKTLKNIDRQQEKVE